MGKHAFDPPWPRRTLISHKSGKSGKVIGYVSKGGRWSVEVQVGSGRETWPIGDVRG